MEDLNKINKEIKILMKRKILSLALALSLVVALVIPASVVMATTVVTAEIIGPPVVTSITPSEDTPSPSAAVVVPVIIAGTNFAAGATVTVEAPGVSVDSIVVVSDLQITADFTLAIGAESGPRDVTVSQAGGDVTVTGGFLVKSYYSIEAPAGIGLGVLTVDEAKEGTSTGTIETNDVTWTVNAVDEGVTAGRMADNGNSLTNELLIGKVTSPAIPASTGFDYTETDGDLPFYVEQTADAADIPGIYSITITFTGSPLY